MTTATSDFQQHELLLNSHKINYYTVGNPSRCPRKFLFIHGHRSDALRFKTFIRGLAEFGEVIVPDLPGCGQSPRYPRRWHSMENYARTLADFIERLNCKDIVLVGGSMGGIIALHLYPKIAQRISKIVLISTPVDYRLFNSQVTKFRRYRPLAKLLVKTRIFPIWGDKLIARDKIAKAILTRKFEPEDKVSEIINYEIQQWRAMSLSVWLQTIYDILNVEIACNPPQITAPAFLVENRNENYYNSQKNLELLKQFAPNHEIALTSFKKHVPKGEIPESFLDPYRKKLREFLERE
ncbi:alpha/beta hydrolase [Patescibacteria group bacterium]|nr:alpha/beta hydrolase [Patescibacteria group bacterium]